MRYFKYKYKYMPDVLVMKPFMLEAFIADDQIFYRFSDEKTEQDIPKQHGRNVKYPLYRVVNLGTPLSLEEWLNKNWVEISEEEYNIIKI